MDGYENLTNIEPIITGVQGISDIKIDKQVSIYKSYLEGVQLTGSTNAPATSYDYIDLTGEQITGAYPRTITTGGGLPCIMIPVDGTYIFSGCVYVVSNPALAVYGIQIWKGDDVDDTGLDNLYSMFLKQPIYITGDHEFNVPITFVANLKEGNVIYFRGFNGDSGVSTLLLSVGIYQLS